MKYGILIAVLVILFFIIAPLILYFALRKSDVSRPVSSFNTADDMMINEPGDPGVKGLSRDECLNLIGTKYSDIYQKYNGNGYNEMIAWDKFKTGANSSLPVSNVTHTTWLDNNKKSDCWIGNKYCLPSNAINNITQEDAKWSTGFDKRVKFSNSCGDTSKPNASQFVNTIDKFAFSYPSNQPMIKGLNKDQCRDLVGKYSNSVYSMYSDSKLYPKTGGIKDAYIITNTSYKNDADLLKAECWMGDKRCYPDHEFHSMPPSQGDWSAHYYDTVNINHLCDSN